ncbi:MAG: rod shape-determining protein RodA [Gammaproteobacteria bacterium]|nr:rod shape-determining protein RodA [Pseudomonadota bacterium]MCH9663374.1 rod shape-determining protein RodA [Gammaproteobacteria bacterium]
MSGLLTYSNRKLPPWLERLARMDAVVLSLACALLALGVINLYSSIGQTALFYRHIVNVVLMLLTVVVVAQIPLRLIIHMAPLLYVACLCALVAVLVVGINVKGSQRWLDLGLLNLQPSEPAKAVTLLMMAWLIRARPLGPSAPRCLMLCTVVALPCALILLQPDLGTSLILIVLGLVFLFLAGIEKRLILLGVVLGCVSIPIVWNNLHDYQKDRILSFSGVEADLTGSGYHAFQSKISVGSGGLYGKGWRGGTQGRLDFLPERSTDFGFSVYAEEFGFFGSMLMLLLFLSLFGRIFSIAAGLEDNAERVLLCACALSLFVHLCVNIGMVVGLLPVVGAPLPFISYGGSAAITFAAQIGIVMSACVHSQIKRYD